MKTSIKKDALQRLHYHIIEIQRIIFSMESDIDSTEKHISEHENTNAPRIIKRQEVAKRLSCELRSVDKLAQKGILKKVLLPGRSRGCGFVESEVNTLINSSQCP